MCFFKLMNFAILFSREIFQGCSCCVGSCILCETTCFCVALVHCLTFSCMFLCESVLIFPFCISPCSQFQFSAFWYNIERCSWGDLFLFHTELVHGSLCRMRREVGAEEWWLSYQELSKVQCKWVYSRFRVIDKTCKFIPLWKHNWASKSLISVCAGFRDGRSL